MTFSYGTDAWQVSCGLTGMPMFWQQDAEPLWKGILLLHQIIYSMPFSYAGMMLNAPPDGVVRIAAFANAGFLCYDLFAGDERN